MIEFVFGQPLVRFAYPDRASYERLYIELLDVRVSVPIRVQFDFARTEWVVERPNWAEDGASDGWTEAARINAEPKYQEEE